ncbi:MAG: SWIM zinc finger family protein [Saprospiraceae bacterium]|nr:SWIM zinc finger family protein [Saprospiraceae bacterium]
MTDKNFLIELIYNDELILQGESLYEKNAVTDLMEVESALYSAKVKDGNVYEIEIQFPFTKKQKASCDCTFYKDNHICKHILSVLFELRAQIKTKNNEKELKIKSTSSKLNTLNISNILQTIDHEDLVSFVRNYAKTDKKFSTQLKVSFARKIDLKDNADKYKSILNTLIRPYTGSGSKTSASEVRNIILVLEDFNDQINDCLVLKQYREAFYIFESAFSKLEYLRHYQKHHEQHLKELSANYHALISQFLTEKLPPDLKKEITANLIDLSGRSYYHFQDAYYNIHHLLSLYADKETIQQISVLIPDLILKKESNEKGILMAINFKIAKKIQKTETEIFKDQKMLAIDVADHLISMQEEKLAIQLLQLLDKPGRFEKEFSGRLIFLYARQQKKSELLEAGIKALVSSKDLKYFDILKKEADEILWTVWYEKIQSAVLKADPTGLLISKLYRKEEKWDDLILLLQSENDIKLLQQYDTALFKADKQALISLYREITFNFMSEHVGDASHQFLKEVLQHLKSVHLPSVVKSLEGFISEQFRHRPALLEVFK